MSGVTEEVATGAEVGNKCMHNGIYSMNDHNIGLLYSSNFCYCR